MNYYKYQGLNLGCLFFSIIVVAIHTVPFNNIRNLIFRKILIIVFELAVPFFFIKCGYFLEKVKIRKTLFKYVRIYIIWTIIYLPLTIYEYINLNLSVEDSMYEFIKGALIYGKHFYSQQLWYILASIYGLLFLNLMINIFENNKYIIVVMSFFLYLIATYIFKDYKISRIFVGASYISIGFSFKDIFNRKILPFRKFSLYILVAAVIKCLTNNIYINLGATVIISLCIFHIFLKIKYSKYDNSILRQISVYIYFIHTYVIFLIETFYKKNHGSLGIKMFLNTLIVSLIISVLFTGIYNRVITINKGIRKTESMRKSL